MLKFNGKTILINKFLRNINKLIISKDPIELKSKKCKQLEKMKG